MSVPNNSPANAITITLPTTITLDMSDLDANGAWYKIVIPTRVYLISLRIPVFSAFIDGIQPYSDAGITESEAFCEYDFPSNSFVVPGQIYYYKITKNGFPPVGSNFSFEFTGPSTSFTEAGQFCISDDQEGNYSGTVWDINGNFIRSVKMSPGEDGDCNLITGSICVENISNTPHTLDIYNRNYQLIISQVVPGNFNPGNICWNQVDKFFFAYNDTTAKVRMIDDTGTFAAQIWNLAVADINSMCPNEGIDKLYFARGNSVPVRVYDLVNSVELANLVSAVADYRIREIVVLQGGNIAVGYSRITINPLDPADSFVKVYSPAGATVSTYVVADGVTYVYDHICRGLDASYYLVWTQTKAGIMPSYSTYTKVNSTSAAVINTFTILNYQFGLAQVGGDPTIAPDFGPCTSCPIFTVLAEIQPNALSGIYKLVPEKRTDTLYTSYDPALGEDVAIPRPSAITGFLSDN